MFPTISPVGFRNAQQERDARTHVYFVQGAWLIKIGFASFPVERFASMLTGCPIPLSLLASTPGGPTLENYLHKRFAADRSHGEWFRRSPDLDAVIASAERQFGPEYHNRMASLARQEGKGPDKGVRLRPPQNRGPWKRSRYEWSPSDPRRKEA